MPKNCQIVVFVFVFLLIVGFEFSRLTVLICKLAPQAEGKERLKRMTDHSRLVGGRLNKQERLHIRLILGGYKMR